MCVSQINNGELKAIGTGSVVWPAAHVLGKYLEKRFGGDMRAVQRVCELGSGTGLCGLVAAALGAQKTILTDQQSVFFLLEQNKADQDKLIAAESVEVHLYDWGEGSEHLGPPFDLILVSDCVLPKLYPIEPLVEAIAALLLPSSSPRACALLSYEHRPYPLFDPRHEFERLATLRGLRTRVVPLCEHHGIYCAEDIEIWEVIPLPTSSVSEECTSMQQKKVQEMHTLEHQEVKMTSWGSSLSLVQAHVTTTKGSYLLSIKQRVQGQSKGGHEVTHDVAAAIGCYLWASSVVLSRFILTNSSFRDFVSLPTTLSTSAGTRPLALDLGAGCGFTSMALALYGFDVIATDKPSVCSLLQENVTAFYESVTISRGGAGNGHGHIEVKSFEWCSAEQGGSEEDEEKDVEVLLERCTRAVQLLLQIEEGEVDVHTARLRYPDLILLSDCLYASTSVMPLLRILKVLSGQGSRVLLCNEMRSSLDTFFSFSRKAGITFSDVALLPSDFEVFRGGSVGTSPPMRVATCIL